MGTFDFEHDLPRVPLPSLEQSTERFLEWSAPLLTEAERAETEAAVAAFLAPGSTAHALQAALEEYDARPDVESWLDDFWRTRYLGRRTPVAINANFFFLFEDSPLDQIGRAAELISGTLAYKRLIDEERLEPARDRTGPLSMHQHRFLFSATRIPGDPLDAARTPYSEAWPGPSDARHVLVLHRGHLIALDVVGPQGVAHTFEEIAEALREIVAATPEPVERDAAVGVLTTKDRAPWAASRARLLAADASNPETLDLLERALLCIALDDHVPASPRDAADHLLHGDGANRWFDKSLTLVIFGDGTAGFNGEHCMLDGTTVISFLDHLLETPAAEHVAVSGARAQGAPRQRALRFGLDDDVRADIAAAAEDFAAFVASTASVTVSVDGFSSTRAKELGSSPDAFAQLAFQLAHQRARGHIGPTYESIATRGFRHGRTEAMRVVTPQIAAFVEAMVDPAAGDEARRAAFRAAADAHVTRSRACRAGDAPEQHLWELELLALRTGTEPPPALYASPGWTVMRDDVLSTSAVPSPHVQYWGFGSTSERCIGIGYALQADRFDVYLSAPRSIAGQLEAFGRELPAAVHELDALLSS